MTDFYPMLLTFSKQYVEVPSSYMSIYDQPTVALGH